MYLKYNQFIKENNKYVFQPESYKITKCNWNNGLLDCFQNVYLNSYYLSKLPFSFGKIYGDFFCGENNLTSFENSPKYVSGNFNCNENKYLFSIEDYPLCIIKGDIISNSFYFEEICTIVKEHTVVFENLLDDKIKFHQMIMRLDTSIIPFYNTISPPTKNSTLLL